MLESRGMITRGKTKGKTWGKAFNSVTSCISIVNYDLYQGQGHSEGHAQGQHPTYLINKKNKEEKEKDFRPSSKRSILDRVWQ